MFMQRKPKKNATTVVPPAPQASQAETNVVPPDTNAPVDEFDAEFEMLAAELAAAFEATQPQPINPASKCHKCCEYHCCFQLYCYKCCE
jgi:hypothetical protein